MKECVLILCRSDRSTILYAAEELKHYLELAGVSVWIAGEKADSPYIKTLRLFSPPKEFRVEDRRYDDAYDIAVTDMEGAIKGANNRSVLLGVYRYLKELGFAFLRPDREGERIPPSVGRHSVHIREEASYRYRGVCIEGAVSFENILEFVTWLPKAGFNTYFTQFKVPYEFFRTWYGHTNNPNQGMGKIPSEEEVDAFVKAILVPHLKKLGLIWQAVGHGFTTGAAGLPGTGWNQYPEEKVPEETREYLAQIDGRRGLFHGVPLNTNLCCSNSEARDMLVREIMNYIHENPSLDMVHVWLADEKNNSCECEACSTRRPSDWYIEILNQVDEALTREGSAVKIVFLAYFDLMWPPLTAKLVNPERFVFMFAPITRSYQAPLPAAGSRPIPPYKRNQCRFPVNGEENMRFCSAWKEYFDGDSFLYDYHYMWNQFRDWGDYGSAEVLWKDLVNLNAAGFAGYVSCQQTRVFAPDGFGMYVMAETLWDRRKSFEVLEKEYFCLVYGELAETVLAYCKELSLLSYITQPECDEPGEDAPAAENLQAAAELILKFRPLFEEKYGEAASIDRTAWKYLLYSGKAAEMYVNMLKYRRLGNEKEVLTEYEKLKNFLRSTEEEWQEGIDVYWFIKNRDPVFAVR